MQLDRTTRRIAITTLKVAAFAMLAASGGLLLFGNIKTDATLGIAFSVIGAGCAAAGLLIQRWTVPSETEGDDDAS